MARGSRAGAPRVIMATRLNMLKDREEEMRTADSVENPVASLHRTGLGADVQKRELVQSSRVVIVEVEDARVRVVGVVEHTQSSVE